MTRIPFPSVDQIVRAGFAAERAFRQKCHGPRSGAGSRLFLAAYRRAVIDIAHTGERDAVIEGVAAALEAIQDAERERDGLTPGIDGGTVYTLRDAARIIRDQVLAAAREGDPEPVVHPRPKGDSYYQ